MECRQTRVERRVSRPPPVIGLVALGGTQALRYAACSTPSLPGLPCCAPQASIIERCLCAGNS
jgi:hypothetical protein